MYPILEFDPSTKAIIDPSHYYKPINGAEYCVMCFFKEVIEKVVKNNKVEIISVLKSELGENPLYQINHKGKNIAFFLAGVGAALAAGNFEKTIAHGFTKFVACGAAGVLNPDIQRGKIIIPNAAIRDEGVSYHYLAPSRVIEIPNQVIAILSRELDRQGMNYLVGKTWTTDGFYRETENKVKKRKAEGCLTVEMECSALAAVATFRKVKFGQYLYGGDDVSGKIWDTRGSKNLSESTREHLFWCAVESCLNL